MTLKSINMAKLVGVSRSDNHPYERRQVELVVDETLTMVVQFSDSCVGCDKVALKQKELERFVQKFSLLTKDEIAVAFMVTSKDIFSLLSQSMPCIGCRRSVERLFSQLVETGHPALEPLIITKKSVLSIKHNFLFDPKAIYALFFIHGSKLNSIIDSIPKSKKNKRCALHSLDTHKSKAIGNWIDVWDVMSQECREEVVLIDIDYLMDTLESYLRKNRFCSECKSKVLRAYSILVGDVDCATEKGYCPTLYEGLRCCPQEHHLHVSCETDFIANLIGRAEPELSGSRRERHAKTLDIAQEEVLTCIGIYLYDRLHRIWQKLRAEEQTWQILFSIGLDALKKGFEMAVEKKQGISNLELVCEELEEEERAKEHKREQKRQKRKRKKNKGKKGETDDSPDKENCKCEGNSGSGSSSAPFTISASCDANTSLNSSSSLSGQPDPCAFPTPCPATNHKPKTGSLNGSLGSSRSDCGYSSGPEGCDSCSMPSSNDGSDIACSEGICNHEGDAGLCSFPDLPELCCHECQSEDEEKSPTQRRCTPKFDRVHRPSILSRSLNGPISPSLNSTNGAGLRMTLAEMLEESCSSEDDGEDLISEEEIQKFKANHKFQVQRQELREKLRQRFNNMQRQACCVRAASSSSLLSHQCDNKLASNISNMSLH